MKKMHLPSRMLSLLLAFADVYKRQGWQTIIVFVIAASLFPVWEGVNE